jgi:hypothetical protein
MPPPFTSPARRPGSATPPAVAAVLAFKYWALAAVAALAFAGAFFGAQSGGAGGIGGGALRSSAVAALPIPPPPPPPPPPPLSAGCTPAQRDAQADAFRRSTPGANFMASACPSLSILAALAAADGASDPSTHASHHPNRLTLVNVGANKGYGVAEVAALWRPDLGINPASVYARLRAAHPGRDPADAAIRGVCGDGEEAVPDVATPPSPPPALTVHAVEPIPPNVDLLRALARDVAESVRAAGPAAPPARLFVHPGAVGPDPGARLGYDPAACEHVGHEACQMQVFRPGLTPVTGWTLDAFFEEHGLLWGVEEEGGVGGGRGGASWRAARAGTVLAAPAPPPRSILLKVDAEGYDGAILMNATTGPGSALDAVRAVEFEYHGVNQWGPGPGQVALEAVVHKLDRAGFDCYLEFGAHLVALTGTCWAEAYEFFQWSNVLCVRRGDVWADAAAGLAVWKDG